MKVNAITLAARAKGSSGLLKRTRSIIHRYGLTPAKMDRALDLFTQILRQFDCGASLPLTAVALKRNGNTITRYRDQNIEFAVHGYTHIDYSQLVPEEQVADLRRAREVFAATGLKPMGFRSPYLCRDSHLYAAIEAAGFSYASNQPVLWDVLDTDALDPAACMAYQRAVDFYAPWLAVERPSLPRLGEHVIEIPVSLPDDEMLLDRIGGGPNGLVAKAWRRILAESYQRGELFTIQLHPERIGSCADGLMAVLGEARALTPSVWLARLDEIATWWRDRAAATVDVKEVGDGALRLSATGPAGIAILVRGVDVVEPAEPWAAGYLQVKGTTIATVYCEQYPFIGVSPGSPPALVDFLCQQGYVVQTATDAHRYAFYLDQTTFTAVDERPLLARIENADFPLVRLGCWPHGARSALAVSGDIDALTIWDYGLRFLGK